MNNIAAYFNGEKFQCMLGLGISLVSIVLSVFFLLSNKVILKGMAYAFLPIALLLLIICVGVIARTSKDIDRVGNFYKSNIEKIQTEELPRMLKVMRSFTVIKKVELVLFFLVSFWLLSAGIMSLFVALL